MLTLNSTQLTLSFDLQKTKHVPGNICKITNSICVVEKKYVQKEIDFIDETDFKQEKDFKKGF